MQVRKAFLPGRLQPWGMAALVCGLVLASYWRSLAGEFIWNDRDYVTRPALRSVAGLGRIWTELGATEQYYPLLHSAFWVQHRLWGDHPLGYHLMTVLLHAGAAVLFAAVLRRLAVPGAWLAALLFALHPVHVESVAWITEQKNTLSLVFYLLAALLYLRFDDVRRPGSYGAALALFALALLCKTVTATLPAALLVLLWWKRGRLTWRRDVGPLLPWLMLGAAAGLFSSWVERQYLGAQGAEFALSVLERMEVAGRAFWFYLGQLFWPLNLNFIYPRWQVDVAAGWQWLFPLGALAFAAVLWVLRRRSRAPLAALLFFAGSLFPVLGFVNLYGMVYSFVWDHWQYLPDLGPLAVVAAGLVWLQNRLVHRARWAGPSLVVVLALLLGTLSWNHSGMFHDDLTLYQTTLARNPACWMAHNNLGIELAKLPGRESDALLHYRLTLQLKPNYAPGHYNLANELAQLPGRLPEALAEYEQALRIKPDYAEAHYNLAHELVKLRGRESEALAHYEQALRIIPDHADAHVGLANILAKLPGRLPEALAHYETALRITPDVAGIHYNLANALARLPGRLPEALVHYEQALRLQPDYVAAHINLANELAKLPGRLPEALAHYEQALRIEPDAVEAHNNLASELAKVPGRVPEALAHFDQALRLKPDAAEVHANLAKLLATLPDRLPEALAHYEQALRLKPDDIAVHVDLANELAKLPGRMPEALAHYEQALRLNPNLADVHYDLAVQLSNLGSRDAEAMGHYQEALRLRPDYAKAQNNLAIIYARHGRMEEARKLWERALELDPNYEDARRNLSLLHRIEGR